MLEFEEYYDVPPQPGADASGGEWYKYFKANDLNYRMHIYRCWANTLVDQYDPTNNRHNARLFAKLCQQVNLQPSEAKKLTVAELEEFIRVANGGRLPPEAPPPLLGHQTNDAPPTTEPEEIERFTLELPEDRCPIVNGVKQEQITEMEYASLVYLRNNPGCTMKDLKLHTSGNLYAAMRDSRGYGHPYDQLIRTPGIHRDRRGYWLAIH